MHATAYNLSFAPRDNRPGFIKLLQYKRRTKRAFSTASARAMLSFELPDYLAKRINGGRAILFLGAGASIGCRNLLGRHPPLGGELAKILSDAISAPFDPQDDSLATVASNAQSVLGNREYLQLLRQHYHRCEPSEDYSLIARYHWPRIYTTNIDDGLETGFRKIDVHGIEVYTHKSPLVARSQSGDAVQLIKLNGCIPHPQDGFIFTTEEYADHMRRINSWYNELAADFSEYTFVFIGTRLDEPLFYWHVDHFMRLTGADPVYPSSSCQLFRPIGGFSCNEPSYSRWMDQFLILLTRCRIDLVFA